MKATARPSPSAITHARSRTPWCRSRRANGPALHAHRAPGWWPPFFRARRLVVRPDAGAVQKRHPELDPALLGQEPQPLPHAQVSPADEGLGRPRPGPQLSRNGAPLGAVLMPPDDRRERAAQILWCGLALGPTRLDQRLQAHPCSVRQHCPLLIPGGAKRPSAQSVQARTGPRCLVPEFDGALFSLEWKDALWAKFFVGAPARRRQCVARSNIVKRA